MGRYGTEKVDIQAIANKLIGAEHHLRCLWRAPCRLTGTDADKHYPAGFAPGEL